MDTFNKKSLCVALAATGVLGAAGVAQAVNVSEDGLGQVLIYPYYTVNKDVNGNSFNTLMSVVNTTASTKAVKVRFREGRASLEVLDFNVFLTPFDVWTAAITPTSAGGAQITTSDKSCTIPSFYTGGVAQQVPFRTLTLEASDNGVTRTAEGYFEIYEMATYDATSVTAINAKHTSAGVPLDCSKVTDTSAALEQKPPTGGLFGGETLLSPAGGGMFSRPAVALANFRTTPLYSDTGTNAPTYASAVPLSNVISNGRLYQSSWGTDGANAVTATLMANAVTNEYVLDIGSKSQTTWILTFATKYEYVARANRAPFTAPYVTKVGACENFYGIVFNREEGSPQVVTGTDFSPQPGPGAGPQLCWEAQSLGFGSTGGGTTASNIFGSANHNAIATPFSNGWATLGFNGAVNASEHALVNTANTNIFDLVNTTVPPVTSATATYFGLPVIGFAAETFQNDAIVVGGKTFLSTFGAAFPHHATKRITP